jgi:hypothetical protein
MVYVIAELRNYRQLVRLRAEALPALESGLAAALGARAVPVPGLPGVLAAALGNLDDMDTPAAGAAASAAARAKEFLDSRRTELFGFTVALADLAPSSARVPGAPEAPAAAGARALLDLAAEDEALWIGAAAVVAFSSVVEETGSGALRKITGLRRADPAETAPRPPAAAWVREGLVSRALAVTASLSEGGRREILYAHGGEGVGKTSLLRSVAARLPGAEAGARVLRLRTIFKRRSPLHPFLGSIDPEILALVPRRLAGPEREAWEEEGGLLRWLVQEDASLELLPDHALEDFGIGYGLYLLAWTRLAEEALAPAVLLCDDVDSYHPSARRLLARLLEDLLARPSFVPLLSAVDPVPPVELSRLALRPLPVYPLGRREVASLAQFTFPGLALPPGMTRRLRRRTGGLPVTVISYLRYLHRLGHVAAREGTWTWRTPRDESTLLPASTLSVAWYLVRSVYAETTLLLYCLYLAGGLLERAGVLAFLAEAGFDPAAATVAVGALAGAGLMEDEDALIPRHPALRRKLEELLGVEAAALRERFVAHLLSLWSTGRYRHPVLLFTFLARSGRTGQALRILPSIVRRRLDENDPAGARLFADVRSLDLAAAPAPDELRAVTAAAAAARLRAALMEDDPVAADAAEVDVRKVLAVETRAARAAAHVEHGKYHLARGDSLAGLDELKQGLLLSQDARDVRPAEAAAEAERAERACHLWLGAAMLAEGRMGEAVEYLGLSQRLCKEAADASRGVWTDAYLATCLFIDGRFTQCLGVVAAARQAARSLYRRELELFLQFLEARVHFQVGFYDECSVQLQAALCTATLYGVEAALPVLRAWLGRTLVHGGEATAGVRLLESLPPTREVLLFLAEAALFSDDLANAALYVDRGLDRAGEFRFPPPEAVCWRDGFAGVEGRCFRLTRGDALLHRTLSALRAFLQGRRGFAAQGIRELHQLTRGEKAMDGDPAAYWFHYLYARVLPDAGGEELDDKGTILGKALKSLQERASRIDGPAQRSSFLWRARWNRLVMEEARERKLV